jgi:hypothetical protein
VLFRSWLWSLVQLDCSYLYISTSGVKRGMKGRLLYQSRERNVSYVRLCTNEYIDVYSYIILITSLLVNDDRSKVEEVTVGLVVLAYFLVAYISRTICLLVFLLSSLLWRTCLCKCRYCITSKFLIVTRILLVDFEAIFDM